MDTAKTPAPAVAGPQAIRNVALVGPAGSGKTRLFARLTGAQPESARRDAGVDPDVSSTSLHAGSVALAEGLVLNLLDTPGSPDFVGELRAGLRAADAALFVVSAVDGVDPATQRLWRECAAVAMPRAVLMTRLDSPHADFEATLAQAQEAFGAGVLPLAVPADGGDALTAVVDLVLGEVHDYSGSSGSSGSGRAVRPTGPEHIGIFERHHGPLMEGIITEAEDDTLLERYLGGEQVPFDVVEAALLEAVARGSFHPVLPVSADTGAGLDVVAHLIAAAFPPPVRRPAPEVFTPAGAPGPELSGDPDGPLVAEVVQVADDHFVGRLSLVRVFSGTLRTDRPVHVSGHRSAFAPDAAPEGDHDEDVRVGALGSPVGGRLAPKPEAIAGDIAVVTKLATARAGDTVSDPDEPLVVRPWEEASPLLPTAIGTASRADADRLPVALARLSASDAALRVEHVPETGQIVLWTMGPAHRDHAVARLGDEFGVNVQVEDVRVPLRETFAAAGDGEGRHVKQSGGHGQYAVCRVTVEPLPRGSGIEFVDEVVGGAVPRQFIPSVEKGVRERLGRGTVTEHPTVDVRVRLRDGKAHSVDSSDAAFQAAGALAVAQAAAAAGVRLLEPVDDVVVSIDDEHLGAVLADLQGRRAHIQGTEPDETPGRTLVRAQVPALELLTYPIELRGLAHGTGTFTRAHSHHEELPERLAAERLNLG